MVTSPQADAVALVPGLQGRYIETTDHQAGSSAKVMITSDIKVPSEVMLPEGGGRSED